ncbi:SbmA/BacA-like family transporter [Candidatus Puniceispirillum sp.]|nr:SbmA/BacA-like family transporter [Candidatus Puniceispirillum sp.]
MTLVVTQQIGLAFGGVESSLQYLVRSWPTIVELIPIFKFLRSFEAIIGSKTCGSGRANQWTSHQSPINAAFNAYATKSFSFSLRQDCLLNGHQALG